MDLVGKRVVVTGGGSGYGKGIAAVPVRAGAEVWITGRSREKLEAAANETGARPFVADVRSGADWDRLLEAVGELDVLVNNAGCGGRIVPMSEQDDASIADVVATNLTGPMLGASRAARMMSARRSGSIVNISSVCAHHAWPGWSAYTATKAGLLKFSHGLFTEMRPFGVRVTCVVPSWGQTNFNRAAGIAGASEDPAKASRCISGEQLGKIVLDLLALPDDLVVPEITVQPMIQEICPM